MEYNREKFERLEQKSVELFATARHIDEQLGEAINKEQTARHHLWANVKNLGLPNSIIAAPIRAGMPHLEALQERYQDDPAGFRNWLEKADTQPVILRAIDDHQSTARELARIQRRRDEHAHRHGQFNASFSRLSSFVRQIEGASPHGVTVTASGGTATNRAAPITGAGWRN